MRQLHQLLQRIHNLVSYHYSVLAHFLNSLVNLSVKPNQYLGLNLLRQVTSSSFLQTEISTNEFLTSTRIRIDTGLITLTGQTLKGQTFNFFSLSLSTQRFVYCPVMVTMFYRFFFKRTKTAWIAQKSKAHIWFIALHSSNYRALPFNPFRTSLYERTSRPCEAPLWIFQ